MPVFIPEVGNGLGPFGYYGLPMSDQSAARQTVRWHCCCY
jgi:hypothetical protein